MNNMSPSAYNQTVSPWWRVFEIGIEVGARYDNPAPSIERARERQKPLRWPEHHQFDAFVREIERPHARFSHDYADLVRFLALSGMRITEATNAT
jgi:hypothetical protein